MAGDFRSHSQEDAVRVLLRVVTVICALCVPLLMTSLQRDALARDVVFAQAPLASVAGVVRFEGAPPPATALDMSSDPYCVQQNAASPALSRAVDVGPQSGLKHVVVFVSSRVAGSPAMPSEPVVLDQQNCTYRPPVIAVAVNQPLQVRNSDGTLHNVHVRAKENRSFNIGQPIRGLVSRRTFTSPEVGIDVSCDVHGWMHGAIAVFDHPYFAVTGADGRFAIDGLPPGEYQLEAWHPTLGTQSATVRVADGSTATPTFTFRTQ
jgi:hypothetical protein